MRLEIYAHQQPMLCYHDSRKPWNKISCFGISADLLRDQQRDLMCWTGYLTCAGCRGLTVALEKSYCWLESADLTWKSADLMVGNMVPSAWFRTDCPCFCEPRCALQMLWLQDLYFSNKNTKLKPEAKACSLCSRPLSSKKIPRLICHHYFLCGMFPACLRRAHCNKHSSAGSWLMTASELHS